jgi:hypothetical protein
MKLRVSLSILLIMSVVLVALAACKDTGATHVAAEEEACRILLDQRKWDDAISTCQGLTSDEGKHLTAIAYMGRSGLTVASMLIDLADDSKKPAEVLFSKIPDTAPATADYNAALGLIMSGIENKTTTMYLEAILLSGLLIFKELKTLIALTLMDGQFVTCAGDPANIEQCDFAPRIIDVSSDLYGRDIPGYLQFNGLGSVFYQNICGAIGGTEDATDTSNDNETYIRIETENHEVYGSLSVDVTYDVAIDSCVIQEGSPLFYNKTASLAYADNGSIDLSSLNFYSKMDGGENFSIEVDPLGAIAFCVAGKIEPPVALDARLSDCEILGFLENPGF